MNIILFTSNITGFKILEKLDEYSFYPSVVTFHKNFQRTNLSRDFSIFYNKFPITFISKNKYGLAKSEIQFTDAPYIICIDWKKDFFKEEKPEGKNIIFAHPSLLPMYRGYGAITEQFLKGVSKSGISFYEANDIIDGGGIIFQKEIIIEFNNYPMDFIEKFTDIAVEFILDLNDKGINSFAKVPQNEDYSFYLTRQRTKNALIDFNRDAYSLHNHIRAYSKPFFGAFFYFNNEKIIVWKAYTEKWQGDYGKPGVILRKNDDGIEVAAGQGTIVITEIEKKEKIYKNFSIPFKENDNLFITS